MLRRDDVTSFLQQPASLFDQHVVSKFMTIRPKVLRVKDFHFFFFLILIHANFDSGEMGKQKLSCFISSRFWNRYRNDCLNNLDRIFVSPLVKYLILTPGQHTETRTTSTRKLNGVEFTH